LQAIQCILFFGMALPVTHMLYCNGVYYTPDRGTLSSIFFYVFVCYLEICAFVDVVGIQAFGDGFLSLRSGRSQGASLQILRNPVERE